MITKINNDSCEVAISELFELCKEVKAYLKRKKYLDLTKEERAKLNDVVTVYLAAKNVIEIIDLYDEGYDK